MQVAAFLPLQSFSLDSCKPKTRKHKVLCTIATSHGISPSPYRQYQYLHCLLCFLQVSESHSPMEGGIIAYTFIVYSIDTGPAGREYWSYWLMKHFARLLNSVVEELDHQFAKLPTSSNLRPASMSQPSTHFTYTQTKLADQYYRIHGQIHGLLQIQLSQT